MRRTRTWPLAAASALVIAAAGPAAAGPERASADSQADVTVEDCVVTSSKDISYVAFLEDGEQVDKDESIDAETFDLTQVEGIDDLDAIEVKSGTTVETFAIDCASEDAPVGGDETDDSEETEEPDETDETDDSEETEETDETDGSDETDETDEADEADETDGSDDEGTEAAEISLNDCTVESTKDISYIAFITDGDEEKRENINAPSFDLTQVEGIDDVDEIEVKSSTTVETFAIDCAFSGDTDGDDAASND